MLASSNQLALSTQATYRMPRYLAQSIFWFMTNLPISEDPVSNSCQGLSNMSIGLQQILSFSPYPLVLGLTVLERWWHAFRIKTVRRHWIVHRNVNLHNLETNRSSSQVVMVVMIKRWKRIFSMNFWFPYWSTFNPIPLKCIFCFPQ